MRCAVSSRNSAPRTRHGRTRCRTVRTRASRYVRVVRQGRSRGSREQDGSPPSNHVRPEPPAGTAGSFRQARLAHLDLAVSPYIYISPFFIIFAVFGVYPVLYTFWVSLHDWAPGALDPQMIGMQNYVDLWADSQFWNAVQNTFGMFFLSTIPQLLLALGLANALNRRVRGRTFFRMSIALPIITSTAAVAIVFSQLFNRDFGIVNYALELLGKQEHIDWQANRFASWAAISAMVDWRWTGYNALIYLAAMQSIPKDIYESAEMDGASKSRQFWRITVPLLRPTIIFTVIISTIGGLQLFTEPLLYSSGAGAISGGSTGQFQTVTMYLYQSMYSRGKFGYAAAIAWMLFLMVVLTVAVNYLITRRINSTGK
ncbi:MAG: sugar ABC transporter permease [Dactylosporangium sp.]|nr:sugar ABC transporter permease [Dactylosporangium sp.]NNJ63877.1 sugar ABC transporter permease [Dactylosporangium sp.]